MSILAGVLSGLGDYMGQDVQKKKEMELYREKRAFEDNLDQKKRKQNLLQSMMLLGAKDKFKDGGSMDFSSILAGDPTDPNNMEGDWMLTLVRSLLSGGNRSGGTKKPSNLVAPGAAPAPAVPAKRSF